MSSDESDSEFHGFNAADFDVTSHTALDNLSDISVSSVKTDDLCNSDEVEERNDQHDDELDTPPTWNLTSLSYFFLRYCTNN